MRRRFDITKTAVAHLNKHLINKTKATPVKVKHRSVEKDWIAWNLWYWCNENAYTLEDEFKFHVERKWRFDWCIPALKLAIEYNGIFSNKSRHTTVTGYTGDMEKLNAAQSDGWTVLQFTPLNYKNLHRSLEKYKR